MKQYSNKTLTVLWDAEKCIHSANCARGLPAVFTPSERPWIKPDNASSDEIMRVIDTCPSGALSYKQIGTTTMEQSPVEYTTTEITVRAQGPLLVKGTCILRDADGNEITKNETFALCRCGSSSNKPFCDGTHKTIDFQG